MPYKDILGKPKASRTEGGKAAKPVLMQFLWVKFPFCYNAQIPMSLVHKTVSHYELISQIGAGGMATVYLANDLQHGRRVAIKFLNADLSTNRFQREIEIAARLTHPHIVPLHDSGTIEGQLYYVMPYVEGESLRERILRQRRLPLEDALRFASEIAGALAYAHDRGLVHRDIKPENVLLCNGIALVADFGIARSTNSTTAITQGNATLGTPAYMSPEQIIANQQIDGRADIYSLGCVIHEMLSGKPPFTGPLHSIVYQHLHSEPKPLSGDVPPHVAYVVMKSLAKEPSDRYATAVEFSEALHSRSSEEPTVSFSSLESYQPALNNLPRDRTSFIGRTQELADCERLFSSSRLLSLTGVGGCGKTRFAIKLADHVARSFANGVWFVDLAPLSDPNRVPGTIAHLLGVREEADKDLLELLATRISNKKMILLLDNCEHLIAACSHLVDYLLNSCPNVHMLVTSREALHVAGERVVPLRSLTLPDANSEPNTDVASAADAVKLFVDRAQMAHGGFTLTKDNSAAVSEICRRLDGIPLAIELAAARVRILSVEQIRNLLDDRFKLLAGGGMIPRHQTLLATIQWSYDQLSREEQRLLRMLSVFAGGWTLDLATWVATRLAIIKDEFELLDVLIPLVDKSLVVVESEHEKQHRYSLLETVRQYAFDRLNEAGETESARRAHMEAFSDLAEQGYSERITHEERWSDELETDNDNLRAALDFARIVGNEQYLTLVGALSWFWQVRSHLHEGHGHLTAALASSTAQPARASRARALWGAANIATWHGNAVAARRWMEEALFMWRELGDTREVALALEGIGWAEFLDGQDEAAYSTFAECFRLQREAGDKHLINRAMVAVAQVLVALGRTEEARPMAHEIIEFSKTHDDKRSEHFGWHFLADCALIQSDCQESLEHYKQSLKLAEALGDRLEISFEVQGVAMSLAGLAETEAKLHSKTELSRDLASEALRLASAAHAEWERIGADIHIRFWDALLERYLDKAKQVLREVHASELKDLSNEWNDAWSPGKSLSFETAISLAHAASYAHK